MFSGSPESYDKPASWIESGTSGEYDREPKDDVMAIELNHVDVLGGNGLVRHAVVYGAASNFGQFRFSIAVLGHRDAYGDR
jgi:hypothetical protein